MDSLATAVAALASARSVDRVTSVVRGCARELTGADGVSFILREDGNCYYADEDAIAPLWKGHRFPMESCVSGWVMLNRKIAVIPDIYADARVPQEAYRPTFVKSLLMVPVRREDPIAAIGAYWAEMHTASNEERSVLQTLADAAALALHNVGLDEDLKRSLAREREARERAEAANRLKEDFLATLSHELRTPLHVMHSWIWQLKKDSSAHTLERALEVMERNVSLQSRMVEDLLAVSQASTERLRLDLQPLDLGTTCRTVVQLLQPAARDKNVRLTLEQATASIWGDTERIQQILWNVVMNGIKFTPSEGKVTVKVERRPRHACIVVEDNGVGIDAEFLPFMFDRFRQEDSSRARHFGGLGLGLAIVKELVQLHGGAVRAESRGKGQGTTITLEFPAYAALDQRGP